MFVDINTKVIRQGCNISQFSDVVTEEIANEGKAMLWETTGNDINWMFDENQIPQFKRKNYTVHVMYPIVCTEVLQQRCMNRGQAANCLILNNITKIALNNLAKFFTGFDDVRMVDNRNTTGVVKKINNSNEVYEVYNQWCTPKNEEVTYIYCNTSYLITIHMHILQTIKWNRNDHY